MKSNNVLSSFWHSPSLRLTFFSLVYISGSLLLSLVNLLFPFQIFGHYAFTYFWYLCVIFPFALFAIRGMFRRIGLVDLAVIGGFYFILLLSAIDPTIRPFAFSSIVTFTTAALPFYFLVRFVTFNKTFRKLLSVFTVFDNLIGFSYILIFTKTTSFTVEEMNFGYCISIFACSACYFFFSAQKKSWKFFWVLVFLLGISTLLLASTRGPLLMTVFFFVYEMMRKTKLKTKIIFGCSVAVISVLFFILPYFEFYTTFLTSLSEYLTSVGLNGRFTSYLSNITLLFDSSGRNILNETVWAAIIRRPLTGYGLFGEYYQLNVFKYTTSAYGYCHQLVLELWCDFGFVFGSIFFVSFLFFLYRMYCVIKKDSDYLSIFVFLFLTGFFVLFFTGTFVTSWCFWMLIGFCVSIAHLQKSQRLIMDGRMPDYGALPDHIFSFPARFGANRLENNPSKEGNARPSKICHIMLSNPFSESMEYQEAILSRKHSEIGYSVSLIVSGDEYGCDKKIVTRSPGTIFSDKGYKIIRLKKPESSSKLKTIGNYYEGLFSVLVSESPDVIFFHNFANASAYDVLRYMQINPFCQLFVDNHTDFGNMSYKTSSILKRSFTYKIVLSFFAEAMASASTRIWGVTPDRCHFLSSVYQIEQPIDLLLMGADEKTIIPSKRYAVRKRLQEEYGIPEEAFVLCFGGVIDKEKNLDVLLASFSPISKNYRNVYLLIFGSFRNNYQNPLANKNYEHVVYVGWRSNQEVSDLFVSSDLGIFPGSHSVLWEQAVACGLPCLFNLIPGKTHINFGGNCLLGSYFDETALRKDLDLVLGSKECYSQLLLNASSEKHEKFWYANIAREAISPRPIEMTKFSFRFHSVFTITMEI